MSGNLIGIDLGTTFSSVACVDDTGRPRIIRNADGKTSTPSVVQVEDGRITVGEVALNQWIVNEEHVVRWIKRSIGDEKYRFQNMSAVEISAEILKVLKADAELEFGEPVEEAVITCPAYFDANEIEYTKRAGELAGFRVREIVKEPTAAAVYYGLENMSDGQKVMVCDLGGGTYDATILAYENGSFLPLACMGDRELGGHDWTMNLTEMVAERFEECFGENPRYDLVAGQKLYEDCERAKRDLARLPKVTIACQYQGRMEQVEVTRDEFEAKTQWLIDQVVHWSEAALEKASLTWNDVDLILLVGGSSRLRQMSLALEERSGKNPVQSGEPDLMVAYGAAILGHGQVRTRKPAGGLVEAPKGGLVEVEFKRIIARNFGTRVIDFSGDEPCIVNSLIIPHSTEVPDGGLSKTRDDYEVPGDDQAFFDVPVVEFESEEDVRCLRSYRFKCAAGTNKGDRISVTFTYDMSGTIDAAAVDLKSGNPLEKERLSYEEPNLDVIVRLKPRWVVFAVDVSGSMWGEKLENAKKILNDSAKELLASNDQCKVGIVSFSSEAKPVCRPTTDLFEVENAVDNLEIEGSTAMDDGIREAMIMAMAAPAGTDRDIVMLTDGMPNYDCEQATLDVSEDVRSKGILLSAMGVSIDKDDVDEAFLKRIAPNALRIEAVQDMAQGMQTLLTQAAEIRAKGLME